LKDFSLYKEVNEIIKIILRDIFVNF